jgi:parvulin-like peptidyl-prolyl isomerase
MSSSLNIGDAQIPFDRTIEQLNQFELYPQLLQEIVIDDLLEEMAVAWSIDVNYTSDEFERKYQEVIKIPALQGMNSSQLESITDRELRLQKFKSARWGDEVEGYFQKQKGGLNRVILSILQVEEGSLMQELFFRIQSGETSFAEAVLDYSQGMHASKGGILGPLLFRELTPAIGQLVKKMEPGELSPLFEMDNYYTVFRLDEWEAAQLDDRMHQFLVDELFNSWLETQISIKVS